jgi:predicted dehydrogenase
MRFALLGNHPDGLQMVRALTATGRHQLVAYSGPAPGAEALRRFGISIKPVGDMEEILADPAVEAVIVAGRSGDRAVQLRRALQSERHVLCVHPADEAPDIAYEAAMIQGDTKQVLLPLLPGALHPAVRQLAEMIRQPDGAIGQAMLLVLEHATTGPASAATALSLPGWDIIRALAGDVLEVSSFAVREEVEADQPLLVSGRCQSDLLFQGLFLPAQPEARYRIEALGSRGRALLELPMAWPGPVRLSWPGDSRDWPDWDPWPVLVEVFEAAAGMRLPTTSSAASPSSDLRNETAIQSAPRADGRKPKAESGWPSWQDEVRCLELDDAARRSVERRRASALEYQEASEEVGFKGTMTLLGCGLLWGLLVLLLLAAWDRRFLWLVIPLLALFLGLQVFRWLIPRQSNPPEPRG